MEDKGWSINRLHQALDGLRGSSYGSVRNYWHGRAEPSLEFLMAAAEAMGVSESWLAHGQGHMTDAREEVAGLSFEAIEESKREEAAAFYSDLLRAMRAPVDYHPRHWMPLLAEARRRLHTDARTLGKALSGPLDALGINAGQMREDAFNDYITAMVPALLLLAPYRPEEEV